MLKLKEIDLSSDYRHGYDPGAKPGLGCKITFQHGNASYETMKLELPPEAVKRVVDCAVAEAIALLVLDPDSVDIEGKAGTPKPDTEQEVATLPATEDAPI